MRGARGGGDGGGSKLSQRTGSGQFDLFRMSSRFPGEEAREAKGRGKKEDAKEEKDNGQSLKKTQGAGEGAANEGGELKSSSGAPGGGHLSRTRK